MIITQWLIQATKILSDAGIQTARLDALILLEDCLNKDRAWVLAHDESKLSPTQLGILNKLLKRRARHEPLAYVRGHCEFYSRKFVVSAATLQPRPESEAFIDLVKELVLEDDSRRETDKLVRIADVGTGCGAIGITLALELPQSSVQLLELDVEAAKIAKTNVDLFTLNLSVITSDLLSSVNDNFDILVCNLPYVPDDYPINKAATHEPRIAIFGGTDGLDLYRRLFKQVRKRPSKPLYILIESFPFQHRELMKIGLQTGYRLVKTSDFVQVFQLGQDTA